MKTLYLDPGPDARARLEALLEEAPGQGTEIVFREGVYPFDRGIILSERHSGLTFRGEGDVRILGGRPLRNWTGVLGRPEAERLTSEAREHVLVCELAGEGIDEAGAFSSRGFGRLAAPSHTELFSDGIPLNLSQYPKREGFLTIGGVPEPDEEGVGDLKKGFFCPDPRPGTWADPRDVQILGYWSRDWANSTERMESYDPKSGLIRTAEPWGNYGFRPGQRFRFYSVLEEVTDPGDYYVDRRAGLAYLYPLRERAEITASVLEDPLFRIQGARNVTLRDLTLECVRGDAVMIRDGESCTVDRCHFRNVGNHAVHLLDGHGNCVTNSTIHDCGDGGILCVAGNRCTLESAGARFLNNHIYRIAKWTKCYRPAIHMIGVGMEARHNLIHDCPHTGIMFWGNDMTVEDNEIYSVVLETGDAGAVYTGRDYTFRGNSVSHNFIHHLGGVGMGTMGIYNDDAVSGTRMVGNYFLDLTRAVMLGGGRDFEVRDNVFCRCDPAIQIDSRAADPARVWTLMCNETMRDRFYCIRRYPNSDPTTPEDTARKTETAEEAGSALSDAYLSRWPELRFCDDMYRTQEPPVRIPAEAVVSGNVFCARPRFRYACFQDPTLPHWPLTITDYGKRIPFDRKLAAYIRDRIRDLDDTTLSGEKSRILWEGNYTADPGDFADPDWGDVSVRADSGARECGYAGGGFDEIGLQESLRRENPVNVRTALRYRPGDADVRIGVRNLGEKTVSGTLRFFAPEGAELERDGIAFTAKAGEEVWYEVGCRLPEDGVLEVRSDLPGVRPART